MNEKQRKIYWGTIFLILFEIFFVLLGRFLKKFFLIDLDSVVYFSAWVAWVVVIINNFRFHFARTRKPSTSKTEDK